MVPGQRAGSGKAAAGFRSPRAFGRAGEEEGALRDRRAGAQRSQGAGSERGLGLFEEAFGFEGWGEGGGPFGVAGFVGVEEVWEFLWFGVAGGVSEEGVGGDEGDLGSGAGGFAVEVVDGLDAGGWA